MGGVVDAVVDFAKDTVEFVGDVSGGTLKYGGKLVEEIGDVTGLKFVEQTGQWVTEQGEFISGDVAEKAYQLEKRSDALQSEQDSLNATAKATQAEYIMEKFLYKNNPNFQFVVTSNDLKYLKYIYPEQVAILEEKMNQLNADIKDFQDKYGDGFMDTKTWLGTWAGDIITGIAMAIGNINGFVSGKEGISWEDALKSLVLLVIIYYTWELGADKSIEIAAWLGIEATEAVVLTIQIVIMTITLDSMFAGSKGLIEILNVFGQAFDALGLTDGSNVFSKFFDSFKKDSDYNGYLVFAVQALITYYMMPSFETMLAKDMATLYAGYNAINAVDSIIKARKEYQEQKEEYEKKMADMQKKAIDTERNARLSKLSNSMIEGDDIVKGTWWNQYAGMQGWMTFDRPNGLFFGTKDSPDDIMFKYDLYAITHPNIRNLGVMPERLT